VRIALWQAVGTVEVFKSADPDSFISHVDLTRIKEYRRKAARLTRSPEVLRPGLVGMLASTSLRPKPAHDGKFVPARRNNGRTLDPVPDKT
jgi:hypothetical protein